MKKMKKLFFILTSTLLLVSCSENETQTDLSTLERGGFAIFEGDAALTANLSDGKYLANVIDSNGNSVSYRIVSIGANINKIAYPAKKVAYSYSFPVKVDLSFSDLAIIFGLTAADIKVNDTFTINAEVTTTDGRIFGGATPPTSGIPGASSTTFVVNNTSNDLLNPANGYKNAMRFTFKVI
jgi:hypothetical protein